MKTLARYLPLVLAGTLCLLVASCWGNLDPPNGMEPWVPDSVLVVYNEQGSETFWFPGKGYMPDGNGISLNTGWLEGAHTGSTCIRAGYDPSQNDWVGVYWLGGNSWEGPGVNLYEKMIIDDESTVKLIIWVKGDSGGEMVQFKVGGVDTGDDSIAPPLTTGWVELRTEWDMHEIDVTDEDLSNVVGGFCWVADRLHNYGAGEVWFYMDDIRFEAHQEATDD